MERSQMAEVLCDYCDTLHRDIIKLWQSPMDPDQFLDGTEALNGFVICTGCAQLAVQAAIFGVAAPPPVVPAEVREIFQVHLEHYQEGVKMAREIEGALSTVEQ